MTKTTALTKDQKAALATITAAGSRGVESEAGWTAAQSLVRKGLVKVEIVAQNVPATKLYPEGPRSATHTLRGKLRMVTLVRWTVVA
jgi:hypothetical protein